jgi:ubiquitin-protein ligase
MVSETPVQGSAKGLKLLHKEIKQLLAKPIEGIEVCANEADLFTLSAIIQGPGISHTDPSLNS